MSGHLGGNGLSSVAAALHHVRHHHPEQVLELRRRVEGRGSTTRTRAVAACWGRCRLVLLRVRAR